MKIKKPQEKEIRKHGDIRYANLREGDIQVLVGRKAQPLPIVTYCEFLGIGLENVEKV